ncbi:receptor-type tyrosine-protein phosphatase kappa-like [Ylistrum balloti]|uniref:receptor-type tyrosine-protein phosphatase kappa-like n=1 Tax=Ylistrum balloti TaxID=509963 RepID=UPI002905F548|nr:receptor-type tyrosine-protein phosphatase kappa-like [Ylistrum balloti]
MDCGNCEAKRCDMTTGFCEKSCLTGWTGQRCDVKGARQSGDEGGNIGTYAGGGAAVVLLAVVIIVTMCKVKRSSTSKENTSEPTILYEKPPSSNNSNEHSDKNEEHTYINIVDEIAQDYPEENSYCNEGPTWFAVSRLKAMITDEMANRKQEFIAQFETFPVGGVYLHTIAEKHKSKNRFKSVYPYDHSRVILDSRAGEKGSDYINANYIDSVEERKVYVATQAPKQNSADDFWRMVWILNSGKIVMLTNLVEGGKEKCVKYWPDEGDPMTTQTFDITLQRERDYAYHVVRSITLIERKSKEKREIQQFHFTNWPDHGTPNTLEFVLFHRRVKLHRTVLPGQMVIHCSAGIGRTGMFIALDALLDFGKKYDRINVRHFVNKMMKDRMNMIHTVEQYIALHEILTEAFLLEDTLIPKSTFVAKYNALSLTGQLQNLTQLRNEFKLILDLKPDYTQQQDFFSSSLQDNETKNRTKRILAGNRLRAVTKSFPSSRNDHINAVITQSYTCRQGYIVTQFPLTDTRADFLALVMDNQCDTIVILGDEKDTGQDTQWMPEDEAGIDVGNFNVKQMTRPTERNDVDVIDVSIKRKKAKAAHSVRIFRLKEWTTDEQVPSSKQSIIHLLEQVDSRRRSSGNKPVVVTCKDGSTQCGLFCLMANTRDQIKMDEEVDVFQAARQLLIRRPEFLSSFEQYYFCYALLKDYLEATDVYIN